jgi:hypothetical protein
MEPDPPRGPEVTAGPPGVRIAVNVLVVLLGVYWVVLAGLLFRASGSGGPGGGSFVIFAIGIVTLIVGVYHGYVSWTMFRLSYRAQGQLALASAVGVGWATFFALLFEAWWPAAVVLFHLLVAVFALAGGRYFDRRFL